MRAAVSSEKPGFVLREAADIRRLFLHLISHWPLPRVAFRIDGLSSLASQRAQDRFARLYEGCNCLMGELAGAAILMGGCYLVWISGDVWSGLGWVVLATVFGALTGKLIELAWVRVRLLLVLRGLRRRIAAGESSIEAGIAVSPIAVQPLRRALNIDDAHGMQHQIQRPVIRNSPKRPSVVLRDAADIDRLISRLATHLKLPRIVVRIDSLAPLDVQRAQVRVVRFSGPSSYLPAAMLATAIFLGGLLYVVWTESQAWFYSTREDWWLLRLDWSDVQPVVIAALCAGLLGVAIELFWMRVRLLLVLRELRRRL